ncbi:hypothetical protein DFH09DRAFT_1336741 [Mycena vulgaris]|nr:hypothetical protein DFH09DRAFT_1336741 [Mycena vulgaris]
MPSSITDLQRGERSEFLDSLFTSSYRTRNLNFIARYFAQVVHLTAPHLLIPSSAQQRLKKRPGKPTQTIMNPLHSFTTTH